MDHERYRELSRLVRPVKSAYGKGYVAGLRHAYFGVTLFGAATTHAERLELKDAYGKGYRDALVGKEPASLLRRQLAPASVERTDRFKRTLWMDDKRWAKIGRLGSEWLERAIDEATFPRSPRT